MGSTSLLPTIARRLEGKVALITGGASGIGKSTAKLFHRHGAKVFIADVQDELGQLVSKDLASPDSFIHCDVSDEEQVRNAIDSVVTRYGKLDIMFNNAGTLDAYKQSIINNEKADFERVLSLNLTGAFLGIKHAARVMIPAHRGSIISTASIASVLGGLSTYAYTSSKHALVGLTKNAAVELGQFGVRVNCVSPYGLVTPLAEKFFTAKGEELEKAMEGPANLKGVYLKAEDIANAALYLGSDESKYVSGHNLVVDGGYTIVNPMFAMHFSAS
ncbi:secoisolariciresinol dehydrogenase-like [Tasmannia lanceolata]|uniref:secoisolariciresinol dehydrogenase-like n=1 Tax=Tasmannia lanceolata TaxID=3420 RepID=UPI004063742F